MQLKGNKGWEKCREPNLSSLVCTWEILPQVLHIISVYNINQLDQSLNECEKQKQVYYYIVQWTLIKDQTDMKKKVVDSALCYIIQTEKTTSAGKKGKQEIITSTLESLPSSRTLNRAKPAGVSNRTSILTPPTNLRNKANNHSINNPHKKKQQITHESTFSTHWWSKHAKVTKKTQEFADPEETT